jgi:hypothetical protein
MSDESKKKQIKHIQEYNKENYVTLRVPISRKYENDIIEHLNKQISKSGYVKELIKKDLKSN